MWRPLHALTNHMLLHEASASHERTCSYFRAFSLFISSRYLREISPASAIIYSQQTASIKLHFPSPRQSVTYTHSVQWCSTHSYTWWPTHWMVYIGVYRYYCITSTEYCPWNLWYCYSCVWLADPILRPIHSPSYVGQWHIVLVFIVHIHVPTLNKVLLTNLSYFTKSPSPGHEIEIRPKRSKLLFLLFLALLDYVSRAREIEIRPSSVVRLWHRLSLKLLHGFLCHMPRLFCHFWKKNFVLIFQEFCSFLLTWAPLGAKTSKRYSSLKSLLNPFKLFLKFLLSGPQKSTVLDFWNFELLIF